MVYFYNEVFWDNQHDWITVNAIACFNLENIILSKRILSQMNKFCMIEYIYINFKQQTETELLCLEVHG